MSSRIRICLVSLVGIEIGRRQEKCGSESHHLFVRSSGIINVEIEVDLLWVAVRPVRRNVVRCELDADPPLADGVNDAMPTVVLEDPSAKDTCPECALCVQVSCVEHDHLTHHPHREIVQSA
jgi:hypothetical protein